MSQDEKNMVNGSPCPTAYTSRCESRSGQGNPLRLAGSVLELAREGGSPLPAPRPLARPGPAEVACCRLDFADWIRQLPWRDRKIARFLATGNGTNDTARRFGVSAGRISQKRKEYLQSWQSFQSEDDPAENGAVAVPA